MYGNHIQKNKAQTQTLAIHPELDHLQTYLTHTLNSNDLWLISDLELNAIMQSKGLNELTQPNNKSLVFGHVAQNAIITAIKQQKIIHIVDTFSYGNHLHSAWLCIEPLVSKQKCYLSMIQIQILDQSLPQRGNKPILNLSSEIKQVPNLKHLSASEQQITGLISAGYTQTDIARILATSRSSIVRKINKICHKVGLSTNSTIILRKFLRGDYVA